MYLFVTQLYENSKAQCVIVISRKDFNEIQSNPLVSNEKRGIQSIKLFSAH